MISDDGDDVQGHGGLQLGDTVDGSAAGREGSYRWEDIAREGVYLLSDKVVDVDRLIIWGHAMV